MAQLHTAETQGQETTAVFEQELYPLIDAVYSFAVRLAKNRDQADDLVQETYLRAWRFRNKYMPGTNARAWLFRICQHVFINQYRTSKRKPQPVNYEEYVVAQVETGRTDWAEQEQDWMTDEVKRALDALDPRFRVVVLLDHEGFTYKEIAELAGIELGTVRSRLNRARTKMAKSLLEYARQRGYNMADCNTDLPDSGTLDGSDDSFGGTNFAGLAGQSKVR
jgi:RNA polymerase sigma factor (sigma-70 family)